MIFFVAGPGLLRAQIRHNDFTQLNSPFSTSNASTVMISPGQMGITGNSFFVGTLPNLNSGINQSRSSLANESFQKNLSSLNGQMATSSQWKSNFPLGPNLPLKMAPTSPTRQPQMFASMQRDSSLNDYTGRDRLEQHEVGPSKFTDGYTFHAVDNGTQLQQVGRELSLQDINRYQFQGSFSGEPGLPVTHAGGNADMASISGASLSNITSGQSLFDANTMPTSHPRSGGAVAPKFITTHGTMPYEPGRGNSMPYTTLGAPSGGGLNAEKSQPGYKTTSDETVQQSATTQQSGKSQNYMPTGSLIPSGTYTPTSASGSQLPIQVDDPEVIEKVEQ
jgi:hypothetical protein